MIRPPRFTGDVAELPTHAYSHRSLTWWGVLGFMVLEGMFFVMLFAAYFFLGGLEQDWPPAPFDPPNMIAGTLFTLLMLLSEIPNTLVKRAAEKEDLRKVQVGLLVMVGIGVVLLVLRGFEFASLNVLWTDNAYGSMIWALLLLHFVHIATDFGDTVVLAALMFTKHAHEGRRFVDTSENSLYWRFVWLTWLPVYILIYWAPVLAE